MMQFSVTLRVSLKRFTSLNRRVVQSNLPFVLTTQRSSTALYQTGQNTPTKSRSRTRFTHCCANVDYRRDAAYLRKLLSDFFLALPDPWKTRASSIMDKQYQELSRRASKGDADALFELFALAEQRKGEGNFNQATVAFRDAAIGYRTFAFRNLDRVKDADSRSAWLAEECNIYRRWIENNPNGLRELPYPAAGITRECIRHVVVDQLLEEDSFAALFSFLLTTLSSMGVEFFSPGGSIQRRVCALLGAVFGLEGSEESECLRNTAVRIALDPIADEVTKRKQEGKVPPSLEEFENELAREL